MDTLRFASSTGNAGLNDLVEVMAFGFDLANTIIEAKSDGGGINIADVPKLFDLITPASKAFDGYENIPGAWQAATEEEKREVYQFFVDNFDITNDEVEAKVEKGVLAALYLLDFVIA